LSAAPTVVPIVAVRRSFATLLIALAVLVASASARADVTSWLAIGGGGGWQRNRPSATRELVPALTYSLGVGSSPLAPVVVGGIARGTTLFGLGTDLGVAVRAATSGFARGDWGLALEAGALWRPWRAGVYGEWPVQAVLTGGSPWGVQLAAGAELWSVSGGTPAQGFFAALEVDLLRLTLMRRGATERWWPNPNPGGGRRTAAKSP
jgi:hypothetical protein